MSFKNNQRLVGKWRGGLHLNIFSVCVPVEEWMCRWVFVCVCIYTGLIQRQFIRTPNTDTDTHTEENSWLIVPKWSRIMERLTRFEKSTSETNSIYREKHCHRSHLLKDRSDDSVSLEYCVHTESLPDSALFLICQTYPLSVSFIWAVQNTSFY